MTKRPSYQDAHRHKPVLVNEVLAYLNPQPGKVYLDVTFGSGGHTRAILEKEPGCKVIALDWDAQALDSFGLELKQEFGDRLQLLWGNFSLLYKILKKEKIMCVDGILADFGTSQVQIALRPGLSLYKQDLLDMRMSPAHQRVTAADVIAKSSERKLREIFWQLGEERFSKRIAQEIVQQRKERPIRTTTQLATLIESVIPPNPAKKIHPATKVFQALRLYVNRELDNILAFLPAALKALCPGGRIVCISFHSLEDRLVKDYFREQKNENNLKLLTPRVVMASDDEVQQNPSSRSARLRAAEVPERAA